MIVRLPYLEFTSMVKRLWKLYLLRLMCNPRFSSSFYSEERGLGGNTVVDMLAKLDINMENLFLGSSL